MMIRMNHLDIYGEDNVVIHLTEIHHHRYPCKPIEKKKITAVT